VIAKLANSQTASFYAYRRPKCAASHGTRVIQIAGALVRIKRGTGFLIGKIFEASALFFCLSEQTRRGIAWEVARQPRD